MVQTIYENEVCQYIPHRYPFVMVDAIHSYSPEKMVSVLTIRADNILVDEGYLQESGIIENIAQTVALKSGYESLQNSKQEDAPIGFVAAIKDMYISTLVPVGQQLFTQIEVALDLKHMIVVRAASSYQGMLVAKGEMHLFLNQ